MAMPMIYEILKQADELKTKNEKIEFLRSNYRNKVMMMILKSAFCPSVKFALPTGPTPYKPCEYLDQQGRLYQEARKFYLFLTPESGGNPGLHQIKRETIWMQLLEGIDPEEAELLEFVKDKHLPFKTVTIELIRETFPQLLLTEDDATVKQVEEADKKRAEEAESIRKFNAEEAKKRLVVEEAEFERLRQEMAAQQKKIEDMNVAELKMVAKEIGIKGISKMKKNQLMTAIKKSQEA